MEKNFLRLPMVAKREESRVERKDGRLGASIALTPKAWAWAKNAKSTFKVSQQAVIETAIEVFSRLPMGVQKDAFVSVQDALAALGISEDAAGSPPTFDVQAAIRSIRTLLEQIENAHEKGK